MKSKFRKELDSILNFIICKGSLTLFFYGMVLLFINFPIIAGCLTAALVTAGVLGVLGLKMEVESKNESKSDKKG